MIFKLKNESNGRLERDIEINTLEELLQLVNNVCDKHQDEKHRLGWIEGIFISKEKEDGKLKYTIII